MALELKDALAVFGYEDNIEDLDVAKLEAFKTKNWIGKASALNDPDLVRSITGNRLGIIETEIKKGFKNLGVEFGEGEVTNKKVEEMYQMGVEKLKASLEDLKKKAQEGAPKDVQKYMEEIENFKTKTTALQTQLDKSNELLEQTKAEAVQKEKSWKLNSKLSDIKGRVPFSEGVDEYKKIGFETLFEKKYKVDLDDSDNIVITRPDGSPVTNDAGNKSLSFEEVYKMEATKAQMLKVNNASTTQTQEKKTTTAVQTGGRQDSPVFRPSPKALLNAQQ